jgi:hypothetical protein
MIVRIIIILLFLPVVAWGDCTECTGSGTEVDPYVCSSWTNLETCVENNSVSGDYIQLSSGNHTANTTVNFSNTKNLTVLGANNTLCGTAETPCSTRITGTANPKFTLNFQGSGETYEDTFIRISGFEHYSSTNSHFVQINQNTGFGGQTTDRYRIDHNYINDSKAFVIHGNAFGVFDNNYITYSTDGVSYMLWSDGMTGFSSAGYATSYSNADEGGWQDWSEGVVWGSKYFHVIEDTVFKFDVKSSPV